MSSGKEILQIWPLAQLGLHANVERFSAFRSSYTDAAGFPSKNMREHSVARISPLSVATAALALLVAAAAFLLRDRDPDERFERAVQELSSRQVEGRLSWFSRWKAFRGAEARPESRITTHARRLLAERAATSHSRAVAELMRGAPGRAIEELLPSASASHDAKQWNDLSVAYLASAIATADMRLAVDGLGAADRALAISPRYEPALFNRALLLERLHLLALARQAWTAYLNVETDPAWQDEALRHIGGIGISNADAEWRRLFEHLKGLHGARLRQAVGVAAATYPQQARRWGENVVLGDWADAITKKDAEAATNRLAFARDIGDAIAANTGDQMLHRAVNEIDVAVRGHREHALAVAILIYRKGRLAHSANRPREAETLLRDAEKRLLRERSSLALSARYYLASSLNAQWRTDAAVPLLEDLAKRPLKTEGYRALAAQLGWERGSAYLRKGAMSNALDAFQKSRDDFAALQEYDLAATMDASTAIVLDLAGDSRSAWSARVRALEQLSRSGNAARILVVLEEAAQSASFRHEWPRAEALKNLTCALAERGSNAVVAAYSWTSRAVIATERGDFRTAQVSIDAGHRWSTRLVDPRIRMRADADLAFARGVLLRDSSPSTALRELDRAVELYAAVHSRTEMPSVHLARARVHERLSSLEEAQKDLEDGLRIVREERRALREPEKRGSLVESANALFDDAIDVALRRGNSRDAFDLADEQRGRSLFDRFVMGSKQAGVSEASSLRAEAIQELLSADAAIVEYAALPDRLVTFVLRRDRLDVVETVVTRERLAEILDDLRAAVRGDRSDPLKACIDAYNVLFRDVAPHLNGVRHVAFVSDPRIGNAPFGALFDAPRGVFVVEQRNITIAANASLLIAASKRWLHGRDQSLLAVGAQRFDRLRFPDAKPLLHVRREILNIASLYEDKKILLDTEATPLAMVQAMQARAIVHFAGHAVLVGSGAAEPALLLASEDGESGELRAGEIAAIELDRTRLVVLAACRSASTPQRKDGNGSLALSFVAAGVPAVVATLSDLDDRESEPFLSRFHTQILKGKPPATALGEASRPAIRDNRGRVRFPLSWANLVTLGGSGEFVKNDEKREAAR